MNDLELAVRTIERLLPDLPDKNLHKWQGIFNTALIKIEAELNSTMMHTCGVCGEEEYGHRTELPIAWREKGDLVICFRHEDAEIADQLTEALDRDKKQRQADTDESLEELLEAL